MTNVILISVNAGFKFQLAPACIPDKGSEQGAKAVKWLREFF